MHLCFFAFFTKGNKFCDFLFAMFDSLSLSREESAFNPIALRRPKLYTILAFLSSVGLKEKF